MLNSGQLETQKGHFLLPLARKFQLRNLLASGVTGTETDFACFFNGKER